MTKGIELYDNEAHGYSGSASINLNNLKKIKKENNMFVINVDIEKLKSSNIEEGYFITYKCSKCGKNKELKAVASVEQDVYELLCRECIENILEEI